MWEIWHLYECICTPVMDYWIWGLYSDNLLDIKYQIKTHTECPSLSLDGAIKQNKYNRILGVFALNYILYYSVQHFNMCRNVYIKKNITSTWIIAFVDQTVCDLRDSLCESALLHPVFFNFSHVIVTDDLLLPECLDEEFVMNESGTHLLWRDDICWQ